MELSKTDFQKSEEENLALMRAKFTIMFLGLFLSISLMGQQEEQFTQFMYNEMYYNPAYAGSQATPSITALMRNQWLGLEGAPQTQMLGFNMPVLNQKIGVGVNLFRHSIGVTNKYTGALSYAYHINVGRGTLGIGLQGSVRLLRVDFSEVKGTQPVEIDGAIPAGVRSKYVPNFGAGLFFNNKKFYLGVSAPRLLQTNIDLADEGGIISREVNHFYLMSGLSVSLGEKVRFQPNILVKYVTGAPFDADLNLSFVFADKITAGASYRLGGSKLNSVGESVSFLLGLKIAPGVTFGAAYDATLTTLKQYNSGTLEGVLQFSIGGEEEGTEFDGPREFF